MSLDKVLVCRNCGKDFIFSAAEQEFFASKGFSNEPSKCKDCRKLAKKEKDARSSVVVCTHCGKTEPVTFTVAHPEFLLCGDCFDKLKPVLTYPSPEPVAGTLETVNLETPGGVIGV